MVRSEIWDDLLPAFFGGVCRSYLSNLIVLAGGRANSDENLVLNNGS